MPDTTNGNALSAEFLQRILDARGWSQVDLAEKTTLNPATVSMHLTKQRPIRDEHLANYLRPLDRRERQLLVAAWLRDTVGRDVIDDLVDTATGRVREDVTEWAPDLGDPDKKMMAWLASEMAHDPDLLGMLRSVCRRIGYQA